jgi:hypothetical protein
VKNVIAYYCTDGEIHLFDMANRGGNPLCAADVFYMRSVDIRHDEHPGCQDCSNIAFQSIEGGEWTSERA